MSKNQLSKGKTDKFNFLLEDNSNKTDKNQLSSIDKYSQNSQNKFNLEDIDLDLDNLVVQDDSISQKNKVLPRGSKINTGSGGVDSIEIEGEVGGKQKTSVFMGRKNGQNHSKIKDIKKSPLFTLQRIGRRLALSAVIFGIFGILFASAAFAWGINQYNNAPNISEQNLFNLKESSVVYARDGKTKIYEFVEYGRREYVKLEKIPEVMQLAILGLEDENYYYNNDAIPWKNLLGAVVECAKSGGGECRGGSGLIQQLVKNVTENKQGSIDRKIKELFTSIKLYNEGVKKDGNKLNRGDLLELYANWVSFGRADGVQQASKSFFGHAVDARENPEDPNSKLLLTPAKACYLAALVQLPGDFSQSVGKENSVEWKNFNIRKDACLYKLAGDGRAFSLRGEGKQILLDNATFEEAKNEKVVFVESKVEDPYPHFRGYVTDELKKFLLAINLNIDDIQTRGLKIITTIDPVIQKNAEEVIQGSKDKLLASGGDNAAGVVLDGPTGEIRAMVGSVDYNDKEIDGQVNILTSPQQPGSSIKPYVYASAFDKGFNPGTVILDTKTNFGTAGVPYFPNNYAKDFRGAMSIHYALSNSRNIPAVKAGFLGSSAGNADDNEALNSFFGFTENIGLRFPCDPSGDGKDACDSSPEFGKEAAYRKRCGVASFIGGCEIKPITHATGINTLLQEGNLRTASPFVSIIDKYGQELYTPDNRQKIYPQEDKKIKPEIARQIEYVMADQARPEFGQYQKYFTIPGWNLAAKTGTTDNNTDTFMVGGSPLYTTVIWAGRTDNKPMYTDTVASNLAAPIWQEIQVSLHKDKEVKDFKKDGLERVILDRYTGFFANYGNIEWLSADQIALLKEAGLKFSKPDYNPYNTNIFSTRSAIIEKKIKINKTDGKIAVIGKTLESNIEDKTCYFFLGEFPDLSNWRESVEVWGRTSSGLAVCDSKLEESKEDQVSKIQKGPAITLSQALKNSAPFPNEVSVNFLTGGGRKLIKATIKINGNAIYSFEDKNNNKDNLDYVVKASDIKKFGDKVSVSIEAEDDKNQKTSEYYSDLNLNNQKINLQVSGDNNLSVSKGFNIKIQSDLAINSELKATVTTGDKSANCVFNGSGNQYQCFIQAGGLNPGSAQIVLNGNQNFNQNSFTLNLTP